MTDPPVPLPEGMALPQLQQRTGQGGRVRWWRSVRIPMWSSAAFRKLWATNKRAFIERGFTMKEEAGAWSLHQWLDGNPGAHTLTAIGSDNLVRALSPSLPFRSAMTGLPDIAELTGLPPLPDNLEAKLYEYQRQPARQLYRALLHGEKEWGYRGAWDCSDLGTGKTYQALAAALATGLEVGVICPKAIIGTLPKYGNTGSGWLGAFAHFGRTPAFVLNYEGLRTGNRDVVQRTGDKGKPFQWTIDPKDTLLIWDEAHNCFPGNTLIATENGPVPIRKIVESCVRTRVLTVDMATGRTTLMRVVSHFRTAPAPLVAVTHEFGRFTCTATHKVWTREGWNQAERLEPGSELRVLRKCFYSRVVSVEVLESGSGHGPSGGGGEDYLYDLEVEGTHCYFADGVLVHNCKNPSLNRSLAFAAIRQGFACIFVSGTMAATPLNLGATGVAVGLHGGDRKSYELFLASHGCTKYGDKWTFPRGRPGAFHLAKIHRTVFPRRGARVKIADLGDRFPETQILCEAVETDATAAIAAAWREAKETIARLKEQHGHAANLGMLEQAAYMKAWHASELAKAGAIAELAGRELQEDRSVAIFVNFTDVREELQRALKTKCAIHGGQKDHDRNTAIADFMADRSRVMLCNIKAGGVGISLHDTNGDYPRTAIILPTNDAVVLKQALGRVHRAGGLSKSRQIVLFAAGTIEEEICVCARRKMNAIASLNDGDLSPRSAF